MRNFSHKIIVFICFALVFMVLASCAIKKEPAEADKFKVVSSFYPIYSITSYVIQNANNVEISNLTNDGGDCLHDYVLLPSDLAELETADAVVINGQNQWKFSTNATVIDASANFSHNADNEHTWLSFDGAISQAKLIAQKLGELDPSNSARYMDNAFNFEEKMKERKATYSLQLAKYENKNVAIAHEGFEYFLRDLGLNVVAKTQADHDSEPTPDEIAIALASIKGSNCRILFVDKTSSATRSIQQMLSEEGYELEIVELSTITAGDGMSDDFFKQYNDNFEKVKQALETAIKNAE